MVELMMIDPRPVIEFFSLPSRRMKKLHLGTFAGFFSGFRTHFLVLFHHSHIQRSQDFIGLREKEAAEENQAFFL